MEMDPGFGTADLPDDFPPQLLPSSFTAGMFTELGSVRSVAFESSSSFDDVVAEYTAKTGEEPIVVLGDVRLASWTVDRWAVSVFEGTPTLIGFTATE